MPDPRIRTVTSLFTDIEGRTAPEKQHRRKYLYRCAGYRRHPRTFSACTPVTPRVGNRDASHRVPGKQLPSRAHPMRLLRLPVARESAG